MENSPPVQKKTQFPSSKILAVVLGFIILFLVAEGAYYLFFLKKDFLHKIFQESEISENKEPSSNSPSAFLVPNETGSPKSLNIQGKVLEIDLEDRLIKVEDKVSGSVRTLDMTSVNSIYYRTPLTEGTLSQRQAIDFSDIVERDFVYFHEGTETLYILKEDFIEWPIL